MLNHFLRFLIGHRPCDDKNNVYYFINAFKIYEVMKNEKQMHKLALSECTVVLSIEKKWPPIHFNCK